MPCSFGAGAALRWLGAARASTARGVGGPGAAMGFARSICEDAEVRELTKATQRELFTVAGAIASPAGGAESPTTYVTPQMVEALTGHVDRIEATEGILSDWSLPGE